jgi:hypothetical protein
MVEVKLTGKPLAERIADRLKNSGDAQHADVVTQMGDGPTRCFTNIFHTRDTDYGPPNKGEGDINGKPRGVV